MEQQFNPANPVAGATTHFATGLGFPAHSVKVNSGPNFVVLYPEGIVIQPGFTNVTHRFNAPSQVATFDVTAPSLAGPSPVGPSQQGQTSIIFTDADLAENPGQGAPSQTVATLETQIGAGQSLNVPTGLARAVTAHMLAVGSQATVTISGTVGTFGGGSTSALIPAEIVPASGGGPGFNFSCGQGTVQRYIFTGTTLAFTTIHLPDVLTIATANAGINISFRFYY